MKNCFLKLPVYTLSLLLLNGCKPTHAESAQIPKDTLLTTESTSVKHPLTRKETRSIPDHSYPSKELVDSFMIFRDKKHFENLCSQFDFADNGSECLLYSLVAVCDFNISRAKYKLAENLTDYFIHPNLGKHSKEISQHYFNEWKIENKDDQNLQRKSFAKYLSKIQANYASDDEASKELFIPKIESTSSETRKLKARSLEGSVDDYNRLKSILYKDDMYGILFYYSYVMADRYDYAPAKEDMTNVLERFHKQYGLPNPKVNMSFFMNFFKTQTTP